MLYLFDCLASYAQELDEIVEAVFPLSVGQDRLEHHTIKRMRLPSGFDVTPVLLRSLMAFLVQYLAIAPSVAEVAGMRTMETLGIVEAAKDAQGRLQMKGGCRENVTHQTERWTCPCGRQSTEEEAGELETTAGRGSDKV